MFSHMFTEHHFNMGHPDNLVFVPELLELLEKSLGEYVNERISTRPTSPASYPHLPRLRCIYCEKLFKTRQILKEHMRKKRHIRIHPKNPRYDRFYILNYSKSGFLTPSAHPSATDPSNDPSNQDGTDDDEETWEDWIDEDADRPKMQCLFCEEFSDGNQKCFDHMIQKHNFDLNRFRRDHSTLAARPNFFVSLCQADRCIGLYRARFLCYSEIGELYSTQDSGITMPSVPVPRPPVRRGFSRSFIILQIAHHT
jgi:hypothetical protein